MSISDNCFKGFLFDLDGTILDTTELIRQSFRYASREVLGELLPDEVLMANVGQPLDKQMELLDKEHARELYDTYRVFNHASHGEYIREYDGMEELLVTLRERGAKLGIVTSKSRRVVDMALEHIPIEHHFDIMVTTDDTENHKPHPQPLQFAMRQLDLTDAWLRGPGEGPVHSGLEAHGSGRSGAVPAPEP